MIKEIQSGSSGNCSYLFYPEYSSLILIDLGISYTKLHDFLLEEEGLELKDNSWLNIAILVTHEHTDHWNAKVFKTLLKKTGIDYIPVFLKDMDFDCSLGQVPIRWKLFKHGSTTTRFYIIDGKYGYLTDVSPSELVSLALWEPAHNLEQLFIEANYDESWKDYLDQLAIANGYDINKGFVRHLSRQESNWLVEQLKPRECHTIHHSSRFYEERKDD